MNVLLAGGCAAAGLVAGVVLDEVAARVPPPRRRAAATEEAGVTITATAPGAMAPEAGAAPAAPVGPVPTAAAVGPSPPAVATTAPAAGEPVAAEPAALPGDTVAPPGVAERVLAAAVTGALFAAAAVRFGAVPELAAYCVLFGGLVALSVADVRVGLLPRKIVYPTLALLAVALAGASAVAGDWRPFLDAAVGGAAGFAVFLAIWLVAPRSMGFGDVRLAGLVGAGLGWLGFRPLYLGFLVAFVAGAVIGLAKMAVTGTGRKTSLPFGPALAVGAVVGVLWGVSLGNLWLHPGG